MIWVTWRQYRPQALTMIGILVAVAAYGLALGLWMRSSFAARGLGACLAGSGGAGCGGAIAAFSRQFTGGPTLPLTLVVFALPPVLGAVTGAPLLGQELERGTWQLAWTQTVPRTRWLVAKLGLVTAGLVAFGVAVTAVMTWAWEPLDLVSIRLTLSPFNFEGLALTCSVLCGFALALLAGLLLRNTIGAMVAGYFAWDVPFVIIMLLTGPSHLLTATTTVSCAAACASASASSTPPVTGHLGDMVTGVVRHGSQLVVSYVPASAFWPLQLITGGIYLAFALAAAGAALWLLRRRTT